MLAFPKRRERARSGIERAPQREFPGHRAWVRGFGCYVPGCPSQIIVRHVAGYDALRRHCEHLMDSLEHWGRDRPGVTVDNRGTK